MKPGDSNSIPVLEDVIREHEIHPKGEAEADEKQKVLWGEDEAGYGAVDEFPADEYRLDEPPTAESAEASLAGNIGPSARPDQETPYDENGCIISSHDDAAESCETMREQADYPATLDPDTEQPGPALTGDAGPWPDAEAGEHDREPPAIEDTPLQQPDQARPDLPPPSTQQAIDIDRVADDILRELAPDLEDYLRRRIRDALRKTLGDNPPG